MPGGVIFWLWRADPALDVRVRALDLAEPGGGEHDVGLLGRLGEEAVDGDDRAGAGQGRGWRGARSGKSASGSAPRSTSTSIFPAAAACEDAGGVEAPLGGQPWPSRRPEPVAAVGQA